MEGGNEQSKRIRHPLADVSLEHAERFENMGPISGPAYGSMSIGSYDAATEAYGGQEMYPTVGNISFPGEPHGVKKLLMVSGEEEDQILLPTTCKDDCTPCAGLESTVASTYEIQRQDSSAGQGMTATGVTPPPAHTQGQDSWAPRNGTAGTPIQSYLAAPSPLPGEPLGIFQASDGLRWNWRIEPMRRRCLHVPAGNV